MPCPTTKSPVQFSPRRWSASSFSSTAQTSQPSACNAFALAEPTRPQPMTTAFIELRLAIVCEHVLREGDDEHLARSVAENVLDGGREEA